MSFPLTVDLIKEIQSTPPLPTPEVSKPSRSDPSIRSTFISRRVEALSNNVLKQIRDGLSSYVIQGLISENVSDIAVGIKLNFPDSKVIGNADDCSILIDWTNLN